MLSGIDSGSSILNDHSDDLSLLTNAVSSKDLKDFYKVGLWSYCEGENTSGVETITACSLPNIQFWFDPFNVWGLQNTSVQVVLGAHLQTGLQRYRTFAKLVNHAYMVAAVLSGASVLIVGPFAIGHRLASLIAMILMIVSFVLKLFGQRLDLTAPRQWRLW